MSIMDGLKSAYDNNREKAAQLKGERGDKLAWIMIEYIGGLGDDKKQGGLPKFSKIVNLFFYKNRIEFGKSVIPSEMVKALRIEGKDELHSRVTLTRMVLTGPFAFAMKKNSRDREVFVTIELTDGRQVVFHDDKKDPSQMRIKLADAMSYYSSKSASQAQESTSALSADDPTAQIERFNKLRESGAITDEEYAQKKKQLLGL